MKKLRAVFLAALMMLSLCACGSTASEKPSTPEATQAPAKVATIEGADRDFRFGFKLEDFTVDGMDIRTENLVDQLMLKYDMVPDQVIERKPGAFWKWVDEDEYTEVFSEIYLPEESKEIVVFHGNAESKEAAFSVSEDYQEKETCFRENMPYGEKYELNAKNFPEYKSPFTTGVPFESYFDVLDLKDVVSTLDGEDTDFVFNSNLGYGMFSFYQHEGFDPQYDFIICPNEEENFQLSFGVDADTGIVQDVDFSRSTEAEKSFSADIIADLIVASETNDEPEEILPVHTIGEFVLSFDGNEMVMPLSLGNFRAMGMDANTDFDWNLSESFSIGGNLVIDGTVYDSCMLFWYNDPTAGEIAEDTFQLTGMMIDYTSESDKDIYSAHRFAFDGLTIGGEITEDDIDMLQLVGFVNPEDEGWSKMFSYPDSTEYNYSQGSVMVVISVTDNIVTGIFYNNVG